MSPVETSRFAAEGIVDGESAARDRAIGALRAARAALGRIASETDEPSPNDIDASDLIDRALVLLGRTAP